jgi:hypothetical protein
MSAHQTENPRCAQPSIYPELNPAELGEYYTRHVEAMSREALHTSSDIAVQLAARDRKIDHQKLEIADLKIELAQMRQLLARDICIDSAETHAGRLERIDGSLAVVRIQSSTWPLGFIDTDHVLLVHRP